MSTCSRYVTLILLTVAGCTSGGDEGLPTTIDAINSIEDLTPDPREEAKKAAAATKAANRAAQTIASTKNVVPSGIFRAEFITTEGKFLVEVNRSWAPIGADRFYSLVKAGFFDDAGFFRVVPGFVVQFGLPADPARNAEWSAGLQDEPVKQDNKKGFLTFAKSSQPNSRTTQLFINLNDNPSLDSTGFSAFGQVIEGMDVVERINSEYRELPNQGQIRSQGNAYLNSRFPNLSYIQTARIVVDDHAQ